MSNQDSHLKSLLSPSRSGTFFAPFRSRSANPEGFDSKMKLWINAIEEWSVSSKKLILCLKDIHQTFISDGGMRPDKECLRLVFTEMKRRSRLVPLTKLKTSSVWSSNQSGPMLENFFNPKGWLSWSVKKLVYDPATWAVSALGGNQEERYSDLTDLSITDLMKFVCSKSLSDLSQNLLQELVRICRAERQSCFEWQHLLELISPIVNTIIDTSDSKDLLENLDLLIDYLAINKKVATLVDNDFRLVKITISENSTGDEVSITKKDVATARLLRAKEKLLAYADSYHNQSLTAKQNALECYDRKELAKAKSFMRSSKRFSEYAEQKEAQLTNVEIMLDQLENTDSNMMILQAYKDGAEALKLANSNIENNTSILDDMYEATAETRSINDEMTRMLNDISSVSHRFDLTNRDLETEFNEMMNVTEIENSAPKSKETAQGDHSCPVDNKLVSDLQERLIKLVVCQDDPSDVKSSTKSEPLLAETAS